jgi:hypothetical protein
MNIGRGWNGSGEDYLHGDEELADAYDYPPLEQWEIDEALVLAKAEELREEQDEAFNELMESVKQADDIVRGKTKPLRVTVFKGE